MQIVLTVIGGPHIGKAFTFDQHDHFFVGRARQAQFRLPEADPYFSRMHFMIEANPPECRLLDLGSTNGTLVNGQKVQLADLKHGDQIQGGDTVIQVTIRNASDGEFPATLLKLATPPEPVREPVIENFAEPVPAITKPLGLVDLPPQEHDNNANKPADEETCKVPGYDCDKRLGSGAMGVVYRARRHSDGKLVAIKFLKPKFRGNDSDYQRFQREIHILRQLDHPAIVQLSEFGRTDDVMYFVMELIEGDNAKLWTEQQPRQIPISVAVGIVNRLLVALDYAHSRGFVHRDVKPGNILISQTGKSLHAKLTDFGLARAYQESKFSGLTLTGDLCGTPKFMAPEQITDARRVQPHSDQYAAAATLYWLLTKKYTHDFDKRIHRALNQILLEEPVPIQKRRPEIPDGLAKVIHRSLSKEPGRRFESAMELRELLRPFVQTR